MICMKVVYTEYEGYRVCSVYSVYRLKVYVVYIGYIEYDMSMKGVLLPIDHNLNVLSPEHETSTCIVYSA